ncbi:MAG: C26 family cysteine hydrolase domain-containing family [Chloroflexi bacterium]|jgi:putative glutamine amidotransferase|nr:C26 family cysteine hydrolase domain-containing family [Chloroflexota bacterium]MBT5627008.1 C26 family cysteine hydrolase domain-containing family [Chloroflexota bacterium]
MSNPARVALLVRPGENPQPFIDAIKHGEGEAVVLGESDSFPCDIGGLLVAGEGAYEASESIPTALAQAIEGSFPVLGIGWGMHALNIALGGQPPIKVEGHGHPDEDLTKHPLFMAPGGKVGYTIAGSGWVTVPSAHTHGLLPAQVADGLLSSVYAEDQVVEAIEMPGREWLIGVQWPAHLHERTPKGFDSLLLALVERSEQ